MQSLELGVAHKISMTKTDVPTQTPERRSEPLFPKKPSQPEPVPTTPLPGKKPELVPAR